jgi:hypothetical protein
MTKAGFRGAVEEIFGLSPGTLKDDDSRGSVESWTSLADAQLFTIIFSEFDIEPDDQLVEADRIGDILGILEAKGAFAG